MKKLGYFSVWALGMVLFLGTGLAEAQDVVQDTMIAVSKTIDDFRCDPAAGSFKAWLLRLTRWRISASTWGTCT